MSAAKTDQVTAAARGRAGMELWLFPTAALLVIVLVAWLSRSVIGQVLASHAIHQSDTALLAWFRARATPPLDSAVRAFTMIGSPFAVTLYAFIGLTMLLNRRQWLLLLTWDVLFLGVWLLTQTIKPLFHRTRPEGAEQFLTTMSFSFPSTHAFGAIAAFGMIAFAITETVELEREHRAVLWLVTVVLAAAIGISRLYLGVHYLSDVLAGFLLGTVWLTVCISAYRRARSKLRQLSTPETRTR